MKAFSRLSLIVTLSASGLLACGSSQSDPTPPQNYTAPAAPAAPASQPMDVQKAVGFWTSNFGPVKIEMDNTGPDKVHGIWLYDQESQEIIGYFSGTTQGTLLRFQWQEPSANGPLRGAGYLSFNPDGSSFSGRWWTESRDRGGDWKGSRDNSSAR